MSESIDNIILEHLKAIRGDLGNIKADISEIKLRLGSIEMSVDSIHTILRFFTADRTGWTGEWSASRRGLI